MKTYIYKIGGRERPSNSKYLRLLYIMNKMPLVHGWASRKLKTAMGLPQSTAINPGFFCYAPNLEVGEHVGLGDTFYPRLCPGKDWPRVLFFVS